MDKHIQIVPWVKFSGKGIKLKVISIIENSSLNKMQKVSKLMEQFNCTMSEANQVIDILNRDKNDN
jgi:hypothetical protein